MSIDELDLNVKLNKFVYDLQLNPIENDRFTASFYELKRGEGKVIFTDINSGKDVKTTWSTYKTDETIMVILFDVNKLVLFEEDYQKFRDRIDNTVIVFPPINQ